MNKVRSIRKDKLMTQRALARRSGLSLRTIHSIEKGLPCRMETKRKVMIALGIEFQDRHRVFPSG